MTEAQKTEVVNLILNTWDFCGNAGVAVKTWQLNNNVALSEKEVGDLFERAHNEWDSSLEEV